MKPVSALVVVFALTRALPAAAQAEAERDERPGGADLGIRIGYAVPFGLDSTFSSAVPFIFEVGYRLRPTITVGGLFQYALAQENDSAGCGTYGATCSGSIIRFGIEALYHFPLESPYGPWFGVGTGYEWMRIDVQGNGVNSTLRARGFELVTAQAGVDVLLSGPFYLGPFVSFSLARYDSVGDGQGGILTLKDITGTHGWLQFGLRGRFAL